ncbi:glycosyltransferase [Aquiflexum sp.]|uniref:glycosyltransferase n=1 Tax=Aquiflexum sp. TaxID=1872584 RepID=UPI0035932D30
MNKNKAPLKVAILGSRGYPYVYSGYETLVKELGERLQKRGVEVRVYCHRSLFENKPAAVNGIKLIYMPAIEQKSLAQLTHSFFSMIHACFSDVDVIFMVNSGNGLFGIISRIFRKPTAINVDGLEWLRPKWKGLGAKYFLFASKMATKFYDRIINDSDEMQKVYIELFNAKSTVIAYGANPSYKSDPSKIEKWGLEKEGYYLIVGRMIPDNNADLILEGFIQSDSTRKLVIVGDVPFQDEYAIKLKNMKDDRLLFTGYITDPEELKALYHNCFAYFHGHEYGGTNPTLLKAMAYGCAILALDTRFSRETLQDGKYGWFFGKDAASVAKLIAKAEESPKEMQILRETAREGLTDKYNWDRVTDRYLEVFEDLRSKILEGRF